MTYEVISSIVRKIVNRRETQEQRLRRNMKETHEYVLSFMPESSRNYPIK